MTKIALTTADMGLVHFRTSALWETTASVLALNTPGALDVHRGLSRDVDPASRQAIGYLSSLQRVPGWMPDTLGPSPYLAGAEPDDLDAVLEVSDDIAAQDLEILDRHEVRPWRGMDVDLFREVVAGCLRTVWRHRIRPLWDAMDEIHAADIRRRTAQASTDGVAQVLSTLHPDVSFDGEVLDVRFPGCTREMSAEGRGLVLVPSVFRWPKVAISTDGPGPIVIAYPVPGAATVWMSGRATSDGLDPLLGSSRAALLRDLGRPRSTTELAGRHGLAIGTVSEHLSILANARLVTAERRGRSVYYAHTVTGASLVDAHRRDSRAG